MFFRHKYRIKFVKMKSNFFGNIHVDVKKSEEAESGVIFTITRLKNGQKMRFVLGFRDFEFLTSPNKSTFLVDFGPGYGKNKPRIGFLSNFGVDMYITKIFPRRFFGFLGSFSPKIVCFLVLRKHLFRHKYHIKFVKMESKFFWKHTCRRKKIWGIRIWGYFYDNPIEKWSKSAICFRFPRFWIFNVSQ